MFPINTCFSSARVMCGCCRPVTGAIIELCTDAGPLQGLFNSWHLFVTGLQAKQNGQLFHFYGLTAQKSRFTSPFFKVTSVPLNAHELCIKKGQGKVALYQTWNEKIYIQYIRVYSYINTTLNDLAIQCWVTNQEPWTPVARIVWVMIMLPRSHLFVGILECIYLNRSEETVSHPLAQE